jgi:hypothetical protein
MQTMRAHSGTRRLIPAALACSIGLGVALAPSVAAGGAHTSASACQPFHSKTVLASSTARLFTRRTTNRDHDKVTALYGCRSGRRPVRMASQFAGVVEERFFGSARLAGNVASVVSFGSDRGNEPLPQELRVFDLKRRRRTALVTTRAGAYVADVELQKSGSVAFIEASSSDPTAGDPKYDRFEVRKREGGTLTLLDSGAAIDPDSLAVSGSTVYWTNGSQAKSAPLR